MPAIQPEQLQRQIDDLLDLAHEPISFIRGCMNLLDYYADRTKRPRGSATKVEIARILRVPRPVMKTLCLQIQQSERGEPAQWLVIGRGLWDKAIREARQVAACTLLKSPEDKIPTEVGDWVIRCEDDEALRDLALVGIKHWRRQDLDRFYRTTGAWLLDSRMRLRHLGILALHGRSQDQDFQELPRMLRQMEGLSSRVYGSSQRSLNALVRDLAQISPPEVAKYLIDEVQANTAGSRRLTQAVMPIFPERLQQELRQVLG
jgi:hypothetical protein